MGQRRNGEVSDTTCARECMHTHSYSALPLVMWLPAESDVTGLKWGQRREETDRTRERGGSRQAWITETCCKWWRYQGFGGVWREAITTLSKK